MTYDQGRNYSVSGQQITPGAEVYDVNGDKVGTVSHQGQQGQYFVVEKGILFPKDLYIPYNAIQGVDANGNVQLNLAKDDLSQDRYQQAPDQGWTDTTGTSTVETVDTTTTGRAGMTASGTSDTITSGTSGMMARDTGTIDRAETDEVRVPLREEELVAGKRQEEIGQVHLHKDVVEEQESVNVPLQREQVTVERVPVNQDAGTIDTGDAFTERDIDVPVMGEEAVVDKQARVSEEVRLQKQPMTEEQQVSDTVRKERVVVDNADQVSGADQEININRQG